MTSQADHPEGELGLDGWGARLVRMADAANVLALLNDPDVVGARTARPPADEAGARAWIEASDARGDLCWVIEDDGRFAGIMALQHLRPERRDVAAGYLLLPAARGKGLATEALAGATAWAFARLSVDRVWLAHDVDNPASCRVAHRAGFRTEGILDETRRRLDGSEVAQEIHACRRDDPPVGTRSAS